MELASISNRISRRKTELMLQLRETITCILSYFVVGRIPRVFIPSLVTFSLIYIMTKELERLFPIGSSRFKIRIYLGFPPTIYDIQTEHWKVKLLVDSLFFNKSDIMNNTTLKPIFIASVLIFHPVFLEIIGNEYSSKYKDPTYHPFIQENPFSLVDMRFPLITFRKWKNEFVQRFNKKNWLGSTFQHLAAGVQKVTPESVACLY